MLGGYLSSVDVEHNTRNAETAVAHAQSTNLDTITAPPRQWRLTASVRVEALTRFLAQQTRLDHAEQQWRRTVLRLLEFLEHLVGDQLEGVQANEIRQPQRPHRVR